MQKKCVFAGTFDPPTIGHKKVVENCARLFDEVVVAILVNTKKECLFTLEERLYLLKKLFDGKKEVRVISFDGAVVDLLEKENTQFYVRGVRDTVDFEYERRDYFASKQLKPDMITLYFPSDNEYTFVSSTLVKNSIHFNKCFDGYIPEEISEDLYRILEEKNV